MNTMIILSDNDLNNKFTQVPSDVHKYVIVVLMMNAIKIKVKRSIAPAPLKLFYLLGCAIAISFFNLQKK